MASGRLRTRALEPEPREIDTILRPTMSSESLNTRPRRHSRVSNDFRASPNSAPWKTAE